MKSATPAWYGCLPGPAVRIRLIAPDWSGEDGGVSSAGTFKVEKVALPLLAALAPPGHSVEIVDEAFAPDRPDDCPDLVGISVMTDLALRAYRIADQYRLRGARVVLGGIHPTVRAAEALAHADAVVVGEAETTWPRVVADAAAGRLQPVYRAGEATDLAGLPQPRRDLYPRPRARGYTPLATGIEASRGCPYDCEFCSIGAVMRGYRTRPVGEVLAEIDSLEDRNLFFVDDALALDPRAARALFSEMIPLRRRWVGQGTVALARDPRLLRLMKRSGCQGLQIGFESVQAETLRQMRKTSRAGVDHAEALHRLHAEGIAVLGAFVFGFDHEDADVFDRTLEFVMENRLDTVQLRILCPFPGTRLHARLEAEKRLLDPEWWLHGHAPDTLLFRPCRMTVDHFLDGYARLNRQVYTAGAILRRFLGMTPWRRTALGCSIFLGFNLATRQRYLHDLLRPQPLRGAPPETPAPPADPPPGPPQ